MQGFIRNRVYILDISLIANDINVCLNTINENLIFMEKMDFRTRHIILKSILINTLCAHISETNTVPTYPLISENIYNDMLMSNEVRISLEILKNNFYNIYKSNIFKFNSNVEVNVDVMLQGTSLYVYTYENDME